MIRRSLIIALGFLIAGRPPLHAAEPDREDFTKAMAAVSPGMETYQIEQLVGRPDDIRTDFDPGGLSTTQTTEIWCYGTNGHLTYPTLGSIFMSNGKAQYVFGGKGNPPAPGMFDETDLRKLMQLIDSASGYDTKPLQLIQIVNTLQPLGKEKALAVLGEYQRVSNMFSHNTGLHVFYIVRLLFEVPEDTGFMPRMMVGRPDVSEPADPKVLPLFPLVMHDDIPLNIVFSYALAGTPQDPGSHLEYFTKHGKIRSLPLTPGNDPLSILGFLEKSPQWRYHGEPGTDEYDRGKSYLAEQLLGLIDTVYQMETDQHGRRLSGDHFDQERWGKILNEVAALNIRWDAMKNMYVFADGTFLPTIKKPYYRRQIWRIPALGPNADISAERMNKDYVRLLLRRSEREGIQVPESVVSVYSVGKETELLTHFKIPSSKGGNFSQQMGDEVRLSELEHIQVEITIGDKTTKCPMMTP